MDLLFFMYFVGQPAPVAVFGGRVLGAVGGENSYWGGLAV
jgi:hypothetical protein